MLTVQYVSRLKSIYINIISLPINFYLILLVLLINNLPSYLGKTFSCGTLDHTGETDATTTCADGTQASKVPLEVCKSGYACAANAWDIPENAAGKPVCIKIPDPVPDPTPDNTVLPGDICKTTPKCYNNAKGVACTGGKCVTTVAIGGDCTAGEAGKESWLCPENSYCDGTKKCVAALSLGATCTKTTPCKSGLGCFSDAAGTAYT
jgi:hypothetical protein